MKSSPSAPMQPPAKLPKSAITKFNVLVAKAEAKFSSDADPDYDLSGARDPTDKARSRELAKAFDYINEVFFGIASLLVGCGIAGIREELAAFRLEIAEEVYRHKWPLLHDYNPYSERLIGSNKADFDKYFDRFFNRVIELSEDWERLEEHLLKLAEWEASGAADVDVDVDASSERRQAYIDLLNRSFAQFNKQDHWREQANQLPGPTISKSVLALYKDTAGDLTGKVSSTKQQRIEAAIVAIAKQKGIWGSDIAKKLGLPDLD